MPPPVPGHRLPPGRPFPADRAVRPLADTDDRDCLPVRAGSDLARPAAAVPTSLGPRRPRAPARSGEVEPCPAADPTRPIAALPAPCNADNHARPPSRVRPSPAGTSDAAEHVGSHTPGTPTTTRAHRARSGQAPPRIRRRQMQQTPHPGDQTNPHTHRTRTPPALLQDRRGPSWQPRHAVRRIPPPPPAGPGRTPLRRESDAAGHTEHRAPGTRTNRPRRTGTDHTRLPRQAGPSPAGRSDAAGHDRPGTPPRRSLCRDRPQDVQAGCSVGRA
jgi:hypothetical protein